MFQDGLKLKDFVFDKSEDKTEDESEDKTEVKSDDKFMFIFLEKIQRFRCKKFIFDKVDKNWVKREQNKSEALSYRIIY